MMLVFGTCQTCWCVLSNEYKVISFFILKNSLVLILSFKEMLRHRDLSTDLSHSLC